jgi:hypothetical protein
MAEVLETQEQFPVQAGDQKFKSMASSTPWIPAFAGMTRFDVSVRFSTACSAAAGYA